MSQVLVEFRGYSGRNAGVADVNDRFQLVSESAKIFFLFVVERHGAIIRIGLESMTKGSSSKRWLQRQEADEYVKRARAEGWRSRAVYKLLEIQERDRLLRPGARVIDLGAAPGAWSQLAAGIVGPSGMVVAVDLLPIDAISGVEVIHGDFRDEQVYETVLNEVGERTLDLVMSDMAPNITGTRSVDQPRAMYLAELAADLAGRTLKPGGAFVAKLFHGEGFDEFVRTIRQSYATVKVRKPKASRPRSRETYLVATEFRL